MSDELVQVLSAIHWFWVPPAVGVVVASVLIVRVYLEACRLVLLGRPVSRDRGDGGMTAKPWNEPPFSDADLAHHRRWLDEHGQAPDPAGCAVCAALIAWEATRVGGDDA